MKRRTSDKLYEIVWINLWKTTGLIVSIRHCDLWSNFNENILKQADLFQ